MGNIRSKAQALEEIFIKRDGYAQALADMQPTIDALVEAAKAALNSIVAHHAAGERIAGQVCEYCAGERTLLLDALRLAGEEM